MSKNSPVESGSGLHTVRVDGMKAKPKRHTHGPVYVIEKGVAPNVTNMNSDFVYVNSAYVGSVNNVRETRAPVALERPNSVIREQYWACSKWPNAQRYLVLAVGVLLGAVVGLAVTMALRNKEREGGGIGGIFTSHAAQY